LGLPNYILLYDKGFNGRIILTLEVIMLIFDYPTKKVLKENIGNPLVYRETSMFGNEFLLDGILTGCNRPHITGHKREFFANVTMKSGLISKVA
jgi:hypothetical protein